MATKKKKKKKRKPLSEIKDNSIKTKEIKFDKSRLILYIALFIAAGAIIFCSAFLFDELTLFYFYSLNALGTGLFASSFVALLIDMFNTSTQRKKLLSEIDKDFYILTTNISNYYEKYMKFLYEFMKNINIVTEEKKVIYYLTGLKLSESKLSRIDKHFTSLEEENTDYIEAKNLFVRECKQFLEPISRNINNMTSSMFFNINNYTREEINYLNKLKERIDKLLNNEELFMSDTFKLYERLLKHRKLAFVKHKYAVIESTNAIYYYNKKETDPLTVKDDCLLLNDVIHKFIKTINE